MTNEAYCNEVYDILLEDKIAPWEEVNDLYVETLLQRLTGAKIDIIYIFYNSNLPRTDLCYIERYFRNHEIDNYRLINIDKISIGEFDRIVNDNNARCFTMVGWPKSKISKIRLFICNKVYRHYYFLYKSRHLITWCAFPFKRKNGDAFFEWINDNKDKIPYIIESLSDDNSKQTFVEIVRATIQNDIYLLEQHCMTEKYFEFYKPLDDEVWINCGSASGDTICHYLNLRQDRFKKIYAFEGETDTFEKLKSNVNRLPNNITEKIELRNEFIGNDENATFDALFWDEKITLINMDIEGAEMFVLKGAKRVIKKYRPVLAICAYHKSADIYDILNFVKNTVEDYCFYLGKYKEYSPEGLCEWVLYCVPNERDL